MTNEELLEKRDERLVEMGNAIEEVLLRYKSNIEGIIQVNNHKILTPSQACYKAGQACEKCESDLFDLIADFASVLDSNGEEKLTDQEYIDENQPATIYQISSKDFL